MCRRVIPTWRTVKCISNMPQLSEDVYYCLSSRTHSHPPKSSWYILYIYIMYYIYHILYIIYIYIFIYIPAQAHTVLYISLFIYYISNYIYIYISASAHRCTWRYKEATARSWRRSSRQKRTFVRKMTWVSWKRLGWMQIVACAKVGCGMLSQGSNKTLIRRYPDGTKARLRPYYIYLRYSGFIQALLRRYYGAIM